MPTISSFYGILIQMFWNDHAPTHSHVRYNEYKAVIEIEGLTITRGKLPPQAQIMVKEWAQLHKGRVIRRLESLCGVATAQANQSS